MRLPMIGHVSQLDGRTTVPGSDLAFDFLVQTDADGIANNCLLKTFPLT